MEQRHFKAGEYTTATIRPGLPGFDDSAWEQVRLDDLGAAQPGWRWYRLHIKLHENHPDLALLIEGGEGIYELYINGAQVPGPTLVQLRVNRPVERVVPHRHAGHDCRYRPAHHTPASYAAWRFPRSCQRHSALQTPLKPAAGAGEPRLYIALPASRSTAPHLSLGLGLFALTKPAKALEYLWLGFISSSWHARISSGISQHAGFMPLSANLLLADPILYLLPSAQIHFTFSFGGQRLGPLAHLHGASPSGPSLPGLPGWTIPQRMHTDHRAVFLIPARGSSADPALSSGIVAAIARPVGSFCPACCPRPPFALRSRHAAIFLAGSGFEFLDNPILLGPVPIEPNDIGNLLFLFAITIVIFFRFSRVSREQARTAAELGAAREIQQRLVPASLPALPGFEIETAYLPAQEVGGDFYQVLRTARRLHAGCGWRRQRQGPQGRHDRRSRHRRPAHARSKSRPRRVARAPQPATAQCQDGGFITCLCARIEPNGAVPLANAGHLSPYRNGAEIPLDPGLPLGIIAGVEYTESLCQLAPGDTLTLLSDGVVEARNSSGQLFGFDRTRALSAQSAAAIAAAAQAFGQEDDITVLTIARSLCRLICHPDLSDRSAAQGVEGPASPAQPRNRVPHPGAVSSRLGWETKPQSSPKNLRRAPSPNGMSGPENSKSGCRVGSWAINGIARPRRASASGPVARKMSVYQPVTSWTAAQYWS